MSGILKVSTVGMAAILNGLVVNSGSDDERVRNQAAVKAVSDELAAQNPRFDAALFAYGCGGALPPPPAPKVAAKPGPKPKSEAKAPPVKS